MRFTAIHSVLLIPFLVFQLLGQEVGLQVVVIEGDGQMVDPHRRVNPEPGVEVRDQNGKPVQGATVTFYLPVSGPGGTFPNGTNTQTLTTDSLGRATAHGIHLNQTLGRFEIRAVASFHGQTATATITQTSVTGISSTSSGGGGHGIGFGTKGWIILGIAAGVIAGGVYLATRGGKQASQNTGIVITPGSPTVGAPQ